MTLTPTGGKKEDWEEGYESVTGHYPTEMMRDFISSLIKAKEEAVYTKGYDDGAAEAHITTDFCDKEEGRKQGRLEILDRVEKELEIKWDRQIQDGFTMKTIRAVLSSLRENEKDITKSNL